MSRWIRYRRKISQLVIVTLAGVVFAWGAVRAAALVQPARAPEPPFAPTPQARFELPEDHLVEPDPQIQRLREADHPLAPGTSFIDSPTPTCYLPARGTNACYINWNYLYVAANASHSMVTMTLSISDRLSANFRGFFQPAMYVPGEMLSPGIRVACGTPGSGGYPHLGKRYPYTIRAMDSSGLGSANYGSVTCPADQVPFGSISLSGPKVGYPDIAYNFTGSAFPVTATLPVTYVWEVTDHTTVTESGELNIARSFSWPTDGLKIVQLTASNPVSSQTQAWTITVERYRIYLPILRR